MDRKPNSAYCAFHDRQFATFNERQEVVTPFRFGPVLAHRRQAPADIDAFDRVLA